MNPKTDPLVFQGRAGWLLWPVPLGSLLGTLLALAYLWASVRFDSKDAGRIAAMGLLGGALALTVWALRAQNRVRTVRQLATGRLAPTEANLLAAIKEVRGLPDWLRRAQVLMWGGGVITSGVAMRLGGELDGRDYTRLFILWLTIAPLSSVLVYLIAAGRSRVLVEAIARLVPPKSVLPALKADQHLKVRTRVGFFTVIFVAASAILLTDAARSATHLTLDAIAKVKRAEQADVAQLEVRGAESRVLALAILLGGLALAAAAMAGKSLADPMRHITDEANRITRGDLREVHVVAAEDEIGAITANFTHLQAQLQDIVGQLQKAGISIGATTEQLMATSSKYETGAADQASSLNETSATTEELAQSARQISHNAGSVSDLAQRTLDAARAGQDSAKAFVNAVDRMKNDNKSIAEAVTRLEKRVQQIGRIVEFITTVADRSDLLALSAELEGTKAGDVGRGFTLVAAEMRRLAENVIESTNEIEELIGEIREATQETVGATARGMEHTESGTELASAVSQSLETVVAMAQNTSDSVRAISLATQQQQTSTDQLAEAMADILGITQQSLAATKQVTSANHELISLSSDLKGLVDRFQVKQ